MIAIANMNLPMVCSQCRFYGERCGADENLILENVEGRKHPLCPLIQLGYFPPRFKKPKEEKSNAPQMPTKDDWEIPSFMKNFKPKETVTFYAGGKPYATYEVEDDEQ